MTHLTKQAATSRLGRAAALSALTLVASAASQAASVRGFEGTSQLDNCLLGQCFRPPDTMGAVGTTQFLEANNGSITVYDKATGAVQSRVNMVNFWASAGLPGGASGDQRVLFDHYTNRWIMTGFGGDTKDINLAISDTANALGPWKSTQFQGVAPGGTADYPTLSLDNKGVYIGTNNFTPKFTGTSLFVIPKASLFVGAPSTAGMTAFNTPLAGPDNGFAIQAALNWGGNPTNSVSVMADSRDFNAQVFYKVSGVNAPGATQTPSTLIAGSGYDSAGPARQPNGTRVVDTLGSRISSNVVQADGKLFSVTTVKADVGDFASVRWSVNDAATGVLIAHGKISGGDYDYFQGSIAVNEFGEVVIGYNRSGFQRIDANSDGKPDGNVSFLASVFDVSASGALVQEGSELLLRVSEVSDYHCSARVNPSACRQRWGDYSAVTIDPTNHHRFWAIGEYAADWAFLPPPNQTLERAIWHTYIAEIDLTAPVPEPETYALMLAGLTAVAWASRRRARRTA